MKQKLLKTWLVMLCMLVGIGSAWGEADYTLTPIVGSNNSYAGNCDVTVDGITWNVTGNAQQIPWRLGGKSISNVDRTVYSKTAYTSAVSKVDLTVGAASSITVNSLKLVYSTNSDFSNSSEISKSFTASSTISFEGDFPANAYYKFVFNVTVSGTSNKFVEFSKVEFYNKASGGSLTPTTYTVSIDKNIANGSVKANLTSAKEGDEVTLTATPADGYEFDSWDVKDASNKTITVTNNKFTMPASNVNVSATFNEIKGGDTPDVPTGRPENEIFYESFDANNGTGGNDNQWSGSIASSSIQQDNEGWVYEKGSGAKECAKLGTGSALGSATTPALGQACNATLTFKAAAWNSNSENTTLKLSVIDGGTISPTTVTLKKGEWTNFSLTLTGLTKSSKVKFEGNAASNSRFFLDEVSVIKTGVATPKTPTSLSWSVPTATATIKSNGNLFPKLTTDPTDLNGVTYSSSNIKVATIDNTGDITLIAAGTTIIKASFAGDATYEAAEDATYELTVNAAPAANYTITLESCGNTIEGRTTISVAEGNPVTLPTASTTAEGFTFKGWSITEQKEEIGTCPALVSNPYYPTANITLFPIFEKGTGEGEYADVWRAASISEITPTGTEFLIVSHNENGYRWINGGQNVDAYINGPKVEATGITNEGYITNEVVKENFKWYVTEESGNFVFTSSSGRTLFNLGSNYSNYARWKTTAKGDNTYSLEYMGATSPFTSTGEYLGLVNNSFIMTTEANSNIRFYIEDVIEIGGKITYTYTSYPAGELTTLTLDENNADLEEIYDEYQKVVVNRTLKADTWNSFCVPFAMSAEQIAENFGSDAEVKKFNDYTVNNGNFSLNFVSSTTIESGVPYMIRVKEAKTKIEITNVDGIEVDNTKNPEFTVEKDEAFVTFHGNYAKQLAPKDSYIISGNKFYFVDSDVTLKGYRGYFEVFSLEESAKALTLSFEDDVTSITNVNSSSTNNIAYNLAGQRVNANAKGILIKNGHKVIVK